GADRAGFGRARDLELLRLGDGGGQVEAEGREERPRGRDLEKIATADRHSVRLTGMRRADSSTGLHYPSTLDSGTGSNRRRDEGGPSPGAPAPGEEVRSSQEGLEAPAAAKARPQQQGAQAEQSQRVGARDRGGTEAAALLLASAAGRDGRGG